MAQTRAGTRAGGEGGGGGRGFGSDKKGTKRATARKTGAPKQAVKKTKGGGGTGGGRVKQRRSKREVAVAVTIQELKELIPSVKENEVDDVKVLKEAIKFIESLRKRVRALEHQKANEPLRMFYAERKLIIDINRFFVIGMNN